MWDPFPLFIFYFLQNPFLFVCFLDAFFYLKSIDEIERALQCEYLLFIIH